MGFYAVQLSLLNWSGCWVLIEATGWDLLVVEFFNNGVVDFVGEWRLSGEIQLEWRRWKRFLLYRKRSATRLDCIRCDCDRYSQTDGNKSVGLALSDLETNRRRNNLNLATDRIKVDSQHSSKMKRHH